MSIPRLINATPRTNDNASKKFVSWRIVDAQTRRTHISQVEVIFNQVPYAWLCIPSAREKTNFASRIIIQGLPTTRAKLYWDVSIF